MCPHPLLRLPGWTDSRHPRRGGPSTPEHEDNGAFMSRNKGHFPMKTCILGSFLNFDGTMGYFCCWYQCL
jgi:hypothetical protein